MNRKENALLIVAFALLVGVFVFIWKSDGNDRKPDPKAVFSWTKVSKSGLSDIPLKLPSGFSISYYATGISAPRALAFDPLGHLVVSAMKDWKILGFKDLSTWGVEVRTVLKGLRNPHGILFVRSGTGVKLYVAEEGSVVGYEYDSELLKAEKPHKIASLPTGGRHTTRSLVLAEDGKILISVGSSCDVCLEKTNRAMILSVNPDGTDLKPFATGLRNAVFMRKNPKSKEIWATEMGRDRLGDDLPPDEINIVRRWGFYGWPYCYGISATYDRNFDSSDTAKNICARSVPALIDIPSHSAPLGLEFIPDTWQKVYGGELLVAYHGSWNRSVPTGYKIVRMKFDTDGNYLSTEDFITGWFSKGKVYGRPVGLLFRSDDGVLFISDDTRGVIYRVTPY